MRDLKHLIYFENLLENSNNELIQQAQDAGRKAIGHVCYQIPEPLLNLPGIFSVRLRAPRTTSTEMGNYYLSPIFCEACRAILERALEGGFSFLDGIIAPEACAMMNRLAENIEHLGCCPHEGFFASYCDVPMKSDEVTLKHYVLQMQEHCLKPLHEHLGIDVSDAAIRKAVEEQNKISRLITEIGEYRKDAQPRITGYEFAIFCLATYCCPKDLLVEKLDLCTSKWVCDFLRRQLISTDLSFELMDKMLFCLVQDNMFRLTFDVVAQDRFKSIDMVLPSAFFKMNDTLHRAVRCCVSDVVFTDEEPNIYLAKLTNIVNSIVTIDDSGKLKYAKPKLKRISTMRSVRTLIGVLLCKVYEDDADDMRNQTIERYGLDEGTFDKYYKMIFGDEDGIE